MAQVADEQLAKFGAILYDCEIVSMIPVDGEKRRDGLFYCGGWEDYEGMGVSVVTAYDFVNSSYRIFLQDNLADLKDLIASRNIIIGYNNQRFDDNLMAANGIVIPPSRSYDIWREITNTQPPGRRSGFRLKDMLLANGLDAKSGEGGDAPMLAQTGQWGKLIQYCLDDTKLSVRLLRLLCNGAMKSPKNGDYMIVRKPWDVVNVEAGEILF